MDSIDEDHLIPTSQMFKTQIEADIEVEKDFYVPMSFYINTYVLLFVFLLS